MLQEIAIKNFAIIEEVHLTFDQGMTILTGETGAGKSIIIDAMNILLGSRASSDYIRHGKDKAEIEGLFYYEPSVEFSNLLESFDIEDEGELLLRRDLLANGRSTCRVNGRLVNLSTLKAVGNHLVDIHGQHEHQALMNPKEHLAMLDAFGDRDFNAIKATYQDLFEAYKVKRAKLVDRRQNAQAYAQRVDILQFQANEIAAAEIDFEKDNALADQRERLRHSQQISERLTTAIMDLEGDGEQASSLYLLRDAMDSLEAIANFDPAYQALSSKIADAYYSLEDVAADLNRKASEMEYNPQELLFLDDRISQLTILKRKYGPELEDVLGYYDGITSELESLTFSEEDSETLELELKASERELLDAAKALSQARHALSDKLEEDIHQELQDLFMPNAKFKVAFEAGKFSRNGNEHIEFYIETNPGEGFKPLAKTASGGEMSRLMLAIKSSLSRRENKTSIVFDEVDTGVSGRVAQAIADKIYKISRSGQVLCISHLPQVVAIADTQFYIEKTVNEGTTTSSVRELTHEERVQQVASMLAGSDVTESALSQARSLLQK
jgi:DNA repair protein RecN (Recombination protein N)